MSTRVRSWTGRRRRRAAVLAAAVVTGLALIAGLGLSGAQGVTVGDGPLGLGDLPINVEWLANTLGRGLDIGHVTNNVIPGALERRDKAIADWKAAEAAAQQAQGQLPAVQANVQSAQAGQTALDGRIAALRLQIGRLTKQIKGVRVITTGLSKQALTRA